MDTNFAQLEALSPDNYEAVYRAAHAWEVAPLEAARTAGIGFLNREPPAGTATNIEARRAWAEAQARLIRSGGDLLRVPDGSTLACMVRDVAMFANDDSVARTYLSDIARANIAAATTNVEAGKLPAKLEHLPNTRNDEYPGLWFTPRLDPRQATSILEVARATLAATADACNRGAVTPARLDQVAIATGRIQMAYDHLERTGTLYDFATGLPEFDFPTPAQWSTQSPAYKAQTAATATETPGMTANAITTQASAVASMQQAAQPGINQPAPVTQAQPAVVAVKAM